MSKNKINFTVDVDGEKVELCVVKPTAAVVQESQRVWNKTLTESLQSGAILRKKLDALLKDQGIWNDQKEAELDEMRKVLANKEVALKKGGVSKAKGRQMALELLKLRGETRAFARQANYLGGATAESLSDNARFNYLVYGCTLYNSGDNAGHKYFDNYEQYLESESEAAIQAASKFAELQYDMVEDEHLKLPEFQFLIKYGFADEKGRLINSDGKLIDEEGRLLNENMEYIDKDGNPVDEFGNPVLETNFDDVVFTD